MCVIGQLSLSFLLSIPRTRLLRRSSWRITSLSYHCFANTMARKRCSHPFQYRPNDFSSQKSLRAAKKNSHLVLRWGMKRPRPDESFLMVNLTGTNGYVPCHHLTRTLIDGWKLPLNRQLPDAGLSRVRLISRTQGSLF